MRVKKYRNSSLPLNSLGLIISSLNFKVPNKKFILMFPTKGGSGEG